MIQGNVKHNNSLMQSILKLAWPTMLEETMQTAVQYIDTAMVGILGTVATAAVGSTTTVNWLIGTTVYSFAVGFLAYISQALGSNNGEKARRATGQAVIVTLLIGIIFTALPLILSKYIPTWMQVDANAKDLATKYFFIIYLPMLPRCAEMIFGTVLRSAGDTKTPMLVSLVINITNVVLNFILIFPVRQIVLFSKTLTIYGADLGVVGAAIASAISYTIGGILITIALLRHKVVAPKPVYLKPDKVILSKCLKIALPNMFQRFCSSLGYVFFAAMINSVGQIETAAHTVANTVESAFYIPGYGMQTAAATLTGNAIGSNDDELRKRTSRAIIVLEVSMMIISGTLLFVFAPNMACLFSKDPKVIDLATTVLRMVSLSEPFYGIAIVTEGMLQGAGQTKIPFVFNVSAMWGIRIAGTFICITMCGLGLVSAWACMIGNNVILCLLYIFYYHFKFKPKSAL